MAFPKLPVLRNKEIFLKNFSYAKEKRCNLQRLQRFRKSPLRYVSHLYCLLKEKENAEQAVEKFVKLLRKKSIDDSVLLQVYKTGFSAKPFDLIRDTLIFAQLITMLNKEVTT